MAGWDEAVALTRSTYEHALPGLGAAAWAAYTRQAWREDAGGRVAPDMDPAIGDAMRSGTATPDLWPLYAQLRDIPALAIRGARSDILSEATFARMLREKPDLRQLTVADRGHAPLLDEPACVAAIDAFLEDLAAP